MTNRLVQARVSHDLMAQANILFSSMGMTTSDAIRIFLQQSVNIGGLPFQPTAKLPNAQTLKAMNQVSNKQGKQFNTAAELFEDLDL